MYFTVTFFRLNGNLLDYYAISLTVNVEERNFEKFILQSLNQNLLVYFDFSFFTLGLISLY